MSVNSSKLGATERPFARWISFASQRGFCWPSNGEPPCSAKAGLLTAFGPSVPTPATSTTWFAPAQPYLRMFGLVWVASVSPVKTLMFSSPVTL